MEQHHTKASLFLLCLYASNHSNNHNRNKSNSVVPRVPKCSFCDGSHSYFKCTEFSNTQSRKERAIKLGLF